MSAAQTDPAADRPAQHVLDAALKRRAELLETTRELSDALEAASPGREGPWAARVAGSLADLQRDIAEHIETTEAPDGVHAEIATAAPRLIHAVARLTADHDVMRERVDACRVLAEQAAREPRPELVRAVRDDATDVVALLQRHRQRGADLVYEAYTTDIGGDD